VTGDSTRRVVTKASLIEGQARRLRQAATLLGAQYETPLSDPIDETIRSLTFLVDRIYSARVDAEVWLLCTAMGGVFPSDRDVETTMAFRDENAQDTFFDWFIAVSAIPAVWATTTALEMRFVSDRPVVDVSSCARYDRHTGIQRVERETLPLWDRDHKIELVAWTDLSGTYRSLTERERARVVDWKGASTDDTEDDASETEFIVPWNTTIVLPEVPDKRQSSRLISIARYSGNRVTAIGYDVIPLTSPELLPRATGSDFLDYLGMMKYTSAVAGISKSATEEFHGFFEAAGGDVASRIIVDTCELPASVPAVELGVAPTERDVPVVLCVGSHEPRKNHIAVLHSAERLWREGIDFELWFFGGGGWGTDFDEQAEILRKRGRKVLLRKAVSDSVLWSAYRDARFTVFPSLHEGFGLPAAESLSFGTPVITTDYGSTREIAERGGSIMVNPRSDAEIHDAMQLLLTDDETYSRLVAEATAMIPRTWDEYANELWEKLVIHESR